MALTWLNNEVRWCAQVWLMKRPPASSAVKRLLMKRTLRLLDVIYRKRLSFIFLQELSCKDRKKRGDVRMLLPSSGRLPEEGRLWLTFAKLLCSLLPLGGTGSPASGWISADLLFKRRSVLLPRRSVINSAHTLVFPPLMRCFICAFPHVITEAASAVVTSYSQKCLWPCQRFIWSSNLLWHWRPALLAQDANFPALTRPWETCFSLQTHQSLPEQELMDFPLPLLVGPLALFISFSSCWSVVGGGEKEIKASINDLWPKKMKLK